jgi:MFS family permease
MISNWHPATVTDEQYDGSLLNGLQTVPRWQQDFDRPAGHTLGLIGASFYLRELFRRIISTSIKTFPNKSAKIPAPYLASYLADRFGRRTALFVGSVFCIIGAIVNTFANGRGMLIGGRVVLGVGTGIQATIAAPMVQELCHPVGTVLRI